MKATKDNKTYTVDQREAEAYRKQGFDIYTDDGKLYAYSATKTIRYADHMKVVDALNAQIADLQKQIDSKPKEASAKK